MTTMALTHSNQTSTDALACPSFVSSRNAASTASTLEPARPLHSLATLSVSLRVEELHTLLKDTFAQSRRSQKIITDVC